MSITSEGNVVAAGVVKDPEVVTVVVKDPEVVIVVVNEAEEVGTALWIGLGPQ